jgi:hypothetical protein
MHYQQWILLAVIVVFGSGVIGSYVQGIAANPGGAEKLWGGVTGDLRTFNYVTMLLAVVGFFLFTYYLFFRTDPTTAQVAGSLNFWVFIVIYALILLPSAFWMPLTFNVLASHNTSVCREDGALHSRVRFAGAYYCTADPTAKESGYCVLAGRCWFNSFLRSDAHNGLFYMGCQFQILMIK